MKVRKGTVPESGYLRRYLAYSTKNKFRTSINDYYILPSIELWPSPDPLTIPVEGQISISPVTYFNHGKPVEMEDDDFFRETQTTAFLIIKDGRLVYEKYFNGYTYDSLFRVMSVTKSVLSALAGISVFRGRLTSTDILLTDLLPEYKQLKRITIQDLLNMQSGLQYSKGVLPWRDMPKAYLHPDINRLLGKVKVNDADKQYFHYNDYNPLILVKVLEKIWQKPLITILQEELWNKTGAAFEARVTIDSVKNGFPKMESGLNCTARDLAKFGLLYLNGGVTAGGERILPEEWIKNCYSFNDGSPPAHLFDLYKEHYWGKLWFSTGKAFYRNYWWGYKTGQNSADCFAMGSGGQILYISPEKNAVAIRLGKAWTVKDWWPRIINSVLKRI